MKKLQENEALYFVAIVPEGETYDLGMYWKQYMAEHFETVAALRSPPHITLQMPFKWKEKKLEQLYQTLSKIGHEFIPFELVIDGFGAFEPRVIFLDIVPNDKLISLQKAVTSGLRRNHNILNADYKDQGFTPHMTIAFRDLKKAVFPVAWDRVKDKKPSSRTTVRQVSLLKHNGKQWEVFRNYKFQSV